MMKCCHGVSVVNKNHCSRVHNSGCYSLSPLEDPKSTGSRLVKQPRLESWSVAQELQSKQIHLSN